MRPRRGISIPTPRRRRGGFLPTHLAGCVLWLDAAQGVTLNVSDVSAWADQSVRANDMAQGVAADQPAFSATGWSNGKPIVDFLASNTEWLSRTGFGQSGPNNYTIITVLNERSVAATNQYLLATVGGGLFTGITTVSNPSAVSRAGGYDGTNHRGAGLADTGEQILTHVWDSSGTPSLKIYRNGVLLGSTDYDGTLDLNLADRTTLGTWAATTGSQVLDGGIAQLIVYDRVLSDAELASVHAWAAGLYLPSFASITGAVFDLDAADGITLNGSDVELWVDTIAGVAFIQVIAVRQPVFVPSTAGLGGKPSVQFTLGTAETLAAASGAAIGNVDASTWFVVIDPITAPTGGRIIASATSSGIIYHSNVSAVYGVYDGTGHKSVTGVAPTVTPKVMSYEFDSSGSGSIRIRENDKKLTHTALTYDKTLGLNDAVSIQLGNDPALVTPLDARIGRILVYNRVLSPAERAAVVAHLIEEYGI